ncbi:MAG: hypothetical protein PHQ98_04565 [Candidatus ainarchaeum sp.]|nr:hypothetical protein [Candidatus ainarchaeum sp.]
MNILVPILTLKENDTKFFEEIVKVKPDQVILLHVMDKSFVNKASSAISDIMQFRKISLELIKKLKDKKIDCEEISEWGVTTKKIVANSLIHKTNIVFLVDDKTEFNKEIIKELESNKIRYALIPLDNENTKNLVKK